MVATFTVLGQRGTGPCLEVPTSTPTVTRKRKLKTGSIDLTERQDATLSALRRFVEVHGVAPARSELAAALNLGKNSRVDMLLHALVRKAWIDVLPGIERGIILLREGAPLYEPEDLRRRPADVRLRGERAKEPAWINCKQLWGIFCALPDLCLHIRGDAMNRAGLADGGIVALARKPDEAGNMTITDGDIVAARIETDVVLRRVSAIDATTVELRPESRSRRHKTVRVERETNDVEIIGIVIGRMLAGAG